MAYCDFHKEAQYALRAHLAGAKHTSPYRREITPHKVHGDDKVFWCHAKARPVRHHEGGRGPRGGESERHHHGERPFDEGHRGPHRPFDEGHRGPGGRPEEGHRGPEHHHHGDEGHRGPHHPGKGDDYPETGPKLPLGPGPVIPPKEPIPVGPGPVKPPREPIPVGPGPVKPPTEPIPVGPGPVKPPREPIPVGPGPERPPKEPFHHGPGPVKPPKEPFPLGPGPVIPGPEELEEEYIRIMCRDKENPSKEKEHYAEKITKEEYEKSIKVARPAPPEHVDIFVKHEASVVLKEPIHPETKLPLTGIVTIHRVEKEIIIKSTEGHFTTHLETGEVKKIEEEEYKKKIILPIARPLDNC